MSANPFAQAFHAGVQAELRQASRITWPCDRWQKDPVGFYETILGLEVWDRQREVLEAQVENRFGAVSAGRKVSKSNTIAGSALWRYSCFPDSRVVFMSTTSRQVDEILWTEVRQLYANSGRCVRCKKDDPHGPRPCPHSACIGGEMHELARSGLKSADFRYIVGYTTRDAVAAQGTSGYNLFYYLDESPGIPRAVIHALRGNCAGGGGIWMFGNPNTTDCEFYEAHSGKKAKRGVSFTISSTETPNVKEGRIVIPGLATREYIEEMREDYGEDSPLYRIHVKGEFVAEEDGKIISIAALARAVERWWDTRAEGRLYVGLDPAGEGMQGDETAMAARRGYKHLSTRTFRGLSEDGILAALLMFLQEYRTEREIPVVVVDREGSIGAPLYRIMRRYSEDNPGSFELIGVRATDRAQSFTTGIKYDRQRDALWANVADWIRRGGAILDDPKLMAELNAPSWRFDINGRLKATPKEDLRSEKMLNRSPDRADALALSVWEFATVIEEAAAGTVTQAQPADTYEPPSLNPYEGVDYWGR